MATAAGKSINLRLQIIVVVALCLLVAVFWYKDNHWKTEWAKRDAADAVAIQKAQEKELIRSEDLREKERQNAAESARIESELQERIKSEKERADSAFDDYQRGLKRLRSQYNCAASATGSAVKNGGSSSISDEAAKCGLQPEDVRAFIRFGSDAEEVRLQLRAAQLELCNAYKTVNGQALSYEVCNQVNQEGKGHDEKNQ